jgi:hypothetical protein
MQQQGVGTFPNKSGLAPAILQATEVFWATPCFASEQRMAKKIPRLVKESS